MAVARPEFDGLCLGVLRRMAAGGRLVVLGDVTTLDGEWVAASIVARLWEAGAIADGPAGTGATADGRAAVARGAM